MKKKSSPVSLPPSNFPRGFGCCDSDLQSSSPAGCRADSAARSGEDVGRLNSMRLSACWTGCEHPLEVRVFLPLLSPPPPGATAVVRGRDEQRKQPLSLLRIRLSPLRQRAHSRFSASQNSLLLTEPRCIIG